MPNVGANAVAFDPNAANTIYVGTDVGVFRTIDLGVSWTAFDNGIPNVVITDLQIEAVRNMLFAATFGRGMYKLDITPGLVKSQVDIYAIVCWIVAKGFLLPAGWLIQMIQATKFTGGKVPTLKKILRPYMYPMLFSTVLNLMKTYRMMTPNGISLTGFIFRYTTGDGKTLLM